MWKCAIEKMEGEAVKASPLRITRTGKKSGQISRQTTQRVKDEKISSKGDRTRESLLPLNLWRPEGNFQSRLIEKENTVVPTKARGTKKKRRLVSRDLLRKIRGRKDVVHLRIRSAGKPTEALEKC